MGEGQVSKGKAFPVPVSGQESGVSSDVQTRPTFGSSFILSDMVLERTSSSADRSSSSDGHTPISPYLSSDISSKSPAFRKSRAGRRYKKGTRMVIMAIERMMTLERVKSVWKMIMSEYQSYPRMEQSRLFIRKLEELVSLDKDLRELDAEQRKRSRSERPKSDDITDNKKSRRRQPDEIYRRHTHIKEYIYRILSEAILTQLLIEIDELEYKNRNQQDVLRLLNNSTTDLLGGRVAPGGNPRVNAPELGSESQKAASIQGSDAQQGSSTSNSETQKSPYVGMAGAESPQWQQVIRAPERTGFTGDGSVINVASTSSVPRLVVGLPRADEEDSGVPPEPTPPFPSSGAVRARLSLDSGERNGVGDARGGSSADGQAGAGRRPDNSPRLPTVQELLAAGKADAKKASPLAAPAANVLPQSATAQVQDPGMNTTPGVSYVDGRPPTAFRLPLPAGAPEFGVLSDPRMPYLPMYNYNLMSQYRAAAQNMMGGAGMEQVAMAPYATGLQMYPVGMRGATANTFSQPAAEEATRNKK